MKRTFLHLYFAGALGTLLSCVPPQIADSDLTPLSNAEAFEGVQCSAVRPQTEPDLMAWDSGSRLNLKRLRSEGVVAVRYEAEGCNVKLELLSNCIADGSYNYTPYSANESKVAHTANELYAQLPIGAASLTGKIKGTKALRTDYALAGQYALPPSASFSRSELHGSSCARATHVVSAIYVGGFALVSGEGRALDAAATVFGAGAGTKSDASVERLANEGNAEACTKAQESQEPSGACDVPLRIGLLALDDSDVAARGPAQSAGMVTIPAGSFMMGSTDGEADEKPTHRVQVSTFSVDRVPVTVADYQRCVSDGACSAPGLGDYCNGGDHQRVDHPINCVDWTQASTYCAWAGKRLLTEEEWEYAARGSDGRTYPWGNEDAGERACWNRLSTKQGTCAVGSFVGGASPFGVLDMAGNVWEWTASGYSDDYSDARASSVRVYRGGGWDDGSRSYLRATDRAAIAPSTRYSSIGIRCAR